MRCGIFVPAASILHVSSTEPPPGATIQSALGFTAVLMPSLIISIVGSDAILLKKVHLIIICFQ